MSRKQFDFDNRRKTEVLYSLLRTGFDTRYEGSQDIDFATKELIPSYKDANDALGDVLKHPIVITGDNMIVVGRVAALGIKILLGEDDPKIPVEVLIDIPSYDALDTDDKLRLRTYAMDQDIPKDRRRGLKDDDLYYNVYHYVENGYTKPQVAEALESIIKAGKLKLWRIEKLYTKAYTAWKQKQLRVGRVEAEELRKAGKPVNFDRICDRLGLPRSAAKDIQSPIRRGQTTMTVIQLKRKQANLSKSKTWADNNFKHYTLTATGALATSDFPDKKPMSASTFIEITGHHLKQAQALVAHWQGALQRAHTQVQRLGNKTSAAAAGE